jgi:chemotaxis protein CheY-P-specific phosphatase CheC
MIEQVTALTELERDALGEIANIAMARAANSIRQMVGQMPPEIWLEFSVARSPVI